MNETMNPAATTEVAIVSNPDNIRMIVESGPTAFNDNHISHDRCLDACARLLDEIAAKGMTDELDQRAAKLIDKTKATLRKMNERRAPVTKLFDRVKKEFTTLENGIDVAKAGTLPFQIQQQRNAYAKKKYEEAEAERRAEEVAQQARIARDKYRADCTEDYKAQFNALVVSHINSLTELSSGCTLGSYEAVRDSLAAYPTELPADWLPQSNVRLPFNLTPEESRAIRDEAFHSCLGQFTEQFRYEVGEYRQDLIDKLPSKKVELERAAKASAEEKARIEAEMKLREQQEAARKEQERMEREREEAARAEAAKSSAVANDLFSLTATQSAYTPKTKVSKKIKIHSPEGYLQVFSMWWSKQGCMLSEEELAKKFKSYVTFCEGVANKDGEFIQHPGVEYIDDVKAK